MQKINEIIYFNIILGVFTETSYKILPVKYIPQTEPKMERTKSNPTTKLTPKLAKKIWTKCFRDCDKDTLFIL